MDVHAALGQLVTLTDATTEQQALETLVEVAAAICGAHYSVALVLGPDGATSAIAHRGMAPHDVAKLPHLPRALGLVGYVLEGRVLRTPDLATHPRAVGLPSGHVAMKALLAVPVTVSRRVLGGMWLTRTPDQPPFTAEDEACAVAIARQIGAVVGAIRSSYASDEVVHSLEDLAERSGDVGESEQRPQPGRSGSEVSSASRTIRRLVATTRSMLNMQMAFLTRIESSRQVFAVVDSVAGAPLVNEGLEVDVAAGYCHLMLDGRLPNSVPDLARHHLTSSMPVTEAIGAGYYCGVPVHLSDGTLYGTLCGLDRDPSITMTPARMQSLETMAALVGARLSVEAERDRQLGARRRDFAPLLAGERRATFVQPITHLTSGRIAGFEALSRFSEATGAPRRPDEVFGEAARLGLTRPLEHAAARSALELVHTVPDGAYLSVNLSPRTILDPDTFTLFAGFSLERVVVELTEQEHVSDYPAVLNALSGLRARGAQLAIDDTGAGFAGLQHLARLEPDIVKLDISFVRDIDTDPSRRAVARAVIGFATEVGASLVAEGVETYKELAVLQDLGATHVQGYLLGRPDHPASYRFGAAPGSPRPHLPEVAQAS